ncbi:MAG: low specificity L-threonine aldolase, partial [Agrobacterium vaccinii]
DKAKAAKEAGASFYDWPVPHDMPEPVGENEQLIRLVTSFATLENDVDDFLRICGGA